MLTTVRDSDVAVQAWLSPKGSVTPTHYDISHNFFVQLQGRKRVLLFPPQSWQQLYLYPALHPGALSAQVLVLLLPYMHLYNLEFYQFENPKSDIV